MDDLPGWLRRSYPSTYLFLVRHLPSVWGACYALLDVPLVFLIVQPIRRLWNRMVARRFLHRLQADPPDLVLTTHFLSSDVVSACRETGRLAAPLIVVVTDLHPHHVWLSARADAFVVGTAHGVEVVARTGVARNRIHPLGIPIAHEFHASANRGALMARFGLDASRRTILVTSGGTTVGPFEAVVETLMGLESTLPGRFQLLVVCGGNAAAAQRLTQRAASSRMPVRVFGFIDNMPEVMAAADVVVAKAGGLTVAEALGRGLPLILYHVIAGQEWLNATHVARHGAALIAPSPRRVAQAVCELMARPDRLAAMRQAAATVGRPDAAEAIVHRVVLPMLERPSP